MSKVNILVEAIYMSTLYIMEDIRLSLDAYTLDRTVGKQRVRTIDQDGSLIYDAP